MYVNTVMLKFNYTSCSKFSEFIKQIQFFIPKDQMTITENYNMPIS